MRADVSAFKILNIFFFIIAAMMVLCSCSDDHSIWKSDYQEIVDVWETQKGEDVLGYEFIYLDDDDIPEIVMHCYDEAWEGFDIYTYIDGKARHLDRYDMDGSSEMISGYPLTSNGHQGKGDCYFSKTGLILQSGGMMGSYWTNGYILVDGKLDCVFEYFYANSTDWAEDADPVSYQIQYKLKDGTTVTRNKEEDVYFEDCIELQDIEKEYSFSYESMIGLPGDNLLTYEEVMDCLKGKRDIVVGADYSNAGKVLSMDREDQITADDNKIDFNGLRDFSWSYYDDEWELEDAEDEYDRIVRYVDSLSHLNYFEKDLDIDIAEDVSYFSYSSYSAISDSSIIYHVFYSSGRKGIYIYAYEEEKADASIKISKIIASESQSAYENFLKGEGKIYFDVYNSDAHNNEFADGCLLDEFLKNRKARNTELTLYEYYDLQYAYIDCGHDGIPELTLRYMYTGEMSESEGDYEFIDVIKYIDGRLELCAEALSHYREYETVNESGIITSSFIDHAGLNIYTSYSGIDKNGKLHDLMGDTDSCGDAIPSIYAGFEGEIDLREIYDHYGDEYYDIHIYSTNINFGNFSGKTIYSYTVPDEKIDADMVINQFEKAGAVWYEYEEYKGMINKVIEEFDLTAALFYGEEPKYRDL